jgi:hypothetical protein
MTEKIKEIVNKYFEDCNNCWDTYKYKLNDSYYVKFQPLMQENHIRVYLGVELPGYEFSTSWVYEIYFGVLNDADKGLAAFIEMQYKEIEKMNKSNVSISYDLYKSVLADNDKLREEIKHLKNLCQEWKDKYFQEKMSHTTTQARIVFAKKILSGERDERIIEHLDITKNG